MNSLGDIIPALSGITVLSSVKIALIVLESLYLMFALIINKQIGLMNKAFTTPYAFLFSLLGKIHFFAIVAILISTIFFL